MTCDDTRNCFDVTYDAGGVILAPHLDPSPENGLICRPGPQPGMWDPNERAVASCATIHGWISSPVMGPGSLIDVPIVTTFAVTNPSATMPADAYLSWFGQETTIRCDPGVRGLILTRFRTVPNPFADAGYHVWLHDYDGVSVLTVPGCSYAFPFCPVKLAPGETRVHQWAYRFQGGGIPGTWQAYVGPLHASALVVVTPP